MLAFSIDGVRVPTLVGFLVYAEKRPTKVGTLTPVNARLKIK